jgi:hypothetical protein
MTCERYWREGVVLYEHGETDSHLETCVDCQQAHAACAQMIEAMPHIGDDIVGNPSWQALVLERIDAIESPLHLRVVAGGKGTAHDELADKPRRPADSGVSRNPPSKWSWWLGGAFAGACAIVCVWLVVGHKPDLDDIHYGITKTESGVTRRSATRMGEPRELDSGSKQRSANIDDAVTITVRPTEEIRVYRADRLVLRCPTLNPRCAADERSVVAHAVFETAGEYQVVVIKPPAGAPKPIAEPVGNLDGDLSAVVSAGGDYEETDYTVN